MSFFKTFNGSITPALIWFSTFSVLALKPKFRLCRKHFGKHHGGVKACVSDDLLDWSLAACKDNLRPIASSPSSFKILSAWSSHRATPPPGTIPSSRLPWLSSSCPQTSVSSVSVQALLQLRRGSQQRPRSVLLFFPQVFFVVIVFAKGDLISICFTLAVT